MNVSSPEGGPTVHGRGATRAPRKPTGRRRSTRLTARPSPATIVRGNERAPSVDALPAIDDPSIIDCVVRTAVVEALGLWLVALGCACGTTVIAPQPGYEWCVEVQNPHGNASDPTALTQAITDPVTGDDPRGCLCFSDADDQILQDGIAAEQQGDPLPASYVELRDDLVVAARVRCSEIAAESEPTLMYSDCLSADVSVPYTLSDSATCIICIEAGVWTGSERQVECPAGLEDATAGVADTSTADATTTGSASVDETGTSDGSGFGLRPHASRPR